MRSSAGAPLRRRTRFVAAMGVLAAAVGVISAAAPATAGAAPAAVVADTPFDPTAPPGINPAGYQACASASYPPIRSAFIAPVAGWADAAKVGGAAAVGWPDYGLVSRIGSDEGLYGQPTIPIKDPSGNTETYRCIKAVLQLDYRGLRELPPFRATFDAFGVAPVTATVTLQQAGPLDRADCLETGPNGTTTTSPACPPVTVIANNYIGGTSTFGRANDAWAVSTVRLTMRLTDVTVNGTPLDVGDDCRTDGELTSPGNPIDPSQVVVFGSNIPGVGPAPDFVSELFGPNALAGTVTIPAFTGCGTAGEDLDPLMTATVSGSGNHAEIIQGAPGGCPDSSCYPPDWTVTGGGTFTTAEAFQFGLSSGGTKFDMTCPNAEVTVRVPDRQGPLRGDLGTVALSGMDGCSGVNGSTWSIRQQAPMAIDAGLTGPPVAGSVNDIQLELQGSGPGTGVTAGGTPCTVIVTGHSDFNYTNPTAVGEGQLNILGTPIPNFGFGDAVAVRTSTCPEIRPGASTLASTKAITPLNLGRLTITNPLDPTAN